MPVRFGDDALQQGAEVEQEAADRRVLEEVGAVFDCRGEPAIALEDVEAVSDAGGG